MLSLSVWVDIIDIKNRSGGKGNPGKKSFLFWTHFKIKTPSTFTQRKERNSLSNFGFLGLIYSDGVSGKGKNIFFTYLAKKW